MAAMPHAPVPSVAVVIVVEDAIHCEQQGRFGTFDEAIEALQRRAEMPWDESPNRAPCTSWATCGREYCVLEYDTSHRPWKLLRSVNVLNISAHGARWAADLRAAWRAAGDA